MINEIAWNSVLEISRTLKCPTRLGLVGADGPTDWDSMIEPSSNYIEPPHYGPVEKSKVEYIEIDPSIAVHIGRLVPKKTIDMEAEIVQKLKKDFVPFTKVGSYIRIP